MLWPECVCLCLECIHVILIRIPSQQVASYCLEMSGYYLFMQKHPHCFFCFVFLHDDNCCMQLGLLLSVRSSAVLYGVVGSTLLYSQYEVVDSVIDSMLCHLLNSPVK